MRKHDPVVSATAMVSQDNDGVVRLMMMPGDRTIDLMQGSIQALLDIARDEPLYVLVDVLPLATIPKHAFFSFYDSPVMPHLRAVAFVGETYETVRLQAFLDEFGPIAIPVRFFESKVEAHRWLLARRAADAPHAA